MNVVERHGSSPPKPPSHELVPRDLAPAIGMAPQALEEDSDPAVLNLLKYLHILAKWWWLIALCGAIGLAAAAANILLTPPQYRATATIQIEGEPAKVVALESQQSETGSGDQFYQTQYGLLKSQALANRVVTNLGLANDARFMNQGRRNGASLAAARTPQEMAARTNRAASLVWQGLHVDLVPHSWLVYVSYESRDPAIAAKIANAVGETYILANLEHRYEASAYARKFLEERLATTRQKLEESERQLVSYAAKNGIIDGGASPSAGAPGAAASSGSTPLAVTDLAAVNSAQVQASTARIQAEQRWRQAESTPDMQLPEVINNSAISGLQSTRNTLQAEYQEKLATYKPDYPVMVDLRTRIGQLDQQIAAQARTIKDGLRSEYLLAVRQEQSLAGAVREQKGSVMDLRSRSIQYNILQREVDTNRTLYDGLLQRYKEIGVAGGVGANNVSVVDVATVPTSPFKPRPAPVIFRFVAVALALGAVLAFLLEQLDVSIKVPEDIKRYLGLPLLGSIPEAHKTQPPLKALEDPRSELSEAYHSVRTALQFSTREGLPSSLLITSPGPGEGKSVTSVALATGLARLGQNVLLIDGDLRMPSLHRLFARDNSEGLSNLLSAAGREFLPSLQPTNDPNLMFLPAGPPPPNPAELLAGDKLRSFLYAAQSEFDVVVIDGPPVLGLADAPLIANVVTGTAMLVRSRMTGRQQAKSAFNRLRPSSSTFLGVILTRFDYRKAGYAYGHAHGFGNGYGSGYNYGSTLKPMKSRGLLGRAPR